MSPSPTAQSSSPHSTTTYTSNTTSALRSNNSDGISDNIEHGLENLLLGSKMHADFDTFYTLGRKLMSGSYGTVFVGVHNISKAEYAIKVIDRRYVVCVLLCLPMMVLL